MGSDVGQIFPTASLDRDHSISYALVCEKILSHIPKHTRSSDPYVSSLSEKSVPHRYPCEISVIIIPHIEFPCKTSIGR